jgi:glycosyltransferase involved in cell wall biosynthesis
LKNLIRVVSPLASEIAIITGRESILELQRQEHAVPIAFFPTHGSPPGHLALRITNFLLVQWRATTQLARIRDRVDLWVFSIDGQNQLLPMLLARALGKPVLLLMAYSAVETLRLTNPILASVSRLLLATTCTLCSRIGVASERLVEDWSLAPWKEKVRVAHEHYIDLPGGPSETPPRAREPLIGFIGRLNPEKGAMEFLEAAAILHARDPSLRFAIVGDGPLQERMEAFVNEHGLEDTVSLKGWIDHALIHQHLGMLRLLVVPSYTESGPMVAYESLAMATPILITRTGLVAEMIEDAVNGFLLTSPSPDSIADGVERAISHPKLDCIALAGRETVRHELAFERTSHRFSKTLDELIDEVRGGASRGRGPQGFVKDEGPDEESATIALLSHPEGGASGTLPLSNLVDILTPLTEKLVVITGSETFETDESRGVQIVTTGGLDGGNGPGTRIVRYAALQFRSALALVRHARKADIWIFFINGQNQVIPMLIGRLLRRRVMLVMAGSTVLSLQAADDPLASVMAVASRLTCGMADRIVLYGRGLVEEYGLERWRDKIAIGPRHIVTIAPSPDAREVEEREPAIGFVGRFSEEKGVLNLVEAMPAVLERVPPARLALIGDGPLRARIEEAILRLGIEDRVTMYGWVPHQALSYMLETLRVIVIPSSTEGLPNVMLESMACGAVVVSTPVGAIRDVIQDGDTGFLMESGDPDSIARTVIRALESPDAATITRKARAFVQKECTLPQRVAQYRRLLATMKKERGESYRTTI